jgi:hypothetical protein
VKSSLPGFKQLRHRDPLRDLCGTRSLIPLIQQCSQNWLKLAIVKKMGLLNVQKRRYYNLAKASSHIVIMELS